LAPGGGGVVNESFVKVLCVAIFWSLNARLRGFSHIALLPAFPRAILSIWIEFESLRVIILHYTFFYLFHKVPFTLIISTRDIARVGESAEVRIEIKASPESLAF
jgi:hypothetical protein